MDFTVRDWMVIVGGLLILAILLDGYRRMRNDPKRIKMSLKKVPATGEEHGGGLHELPNGGARVIGRDLMSDTDAILFSDPGTEPDAADPSLFAAEESLAEGFSAHSAAADPLDALSLEPGRRAPAHSDSTVDKEVIMLNVVARDEAGFFGDDILQILLACELRFGELSFFHRHEEAAGKGAIQFSVANMVQPGVFDIDAMADFHTPGLSFFLSLPGPENMMQAFDVMVETAQCVADNLEGDLLDASRSVMTKQTLDHSRQQIRDMERRLLAVSR